MKQYHIHLFVTLRFLSLTIFWVQILFIIIVFSKYWFYWWSPNFPVTKLYLSRNHFKHWKVYLMHWSFPSLSTSAMNPSWHLQEPVVIRNVTESFLLLSLLLILLLPLHDTEHTPLLQLTFVPQQQPIILRMI